MSVIFALAYADRVEMITDGATIDREGIMVEIRRKVWTAGRLPLAITGRGNIRSVASYAHCLRWFAWTSRDVDAALAKFRRALTIGRRMAHHMDFFELVVVGVSPTRGPLILACQSRPAGGVEAMTLTDMDGFAYAGPPVIFPRPELLAAGLAPFGPGFIEDARNTPGFAENDESSAPVFSIGGFLDLTCVSAAGATVSRLRNWPDRVGQPIRPRRPKPVVRTQAGTVAAGRTS